MFHISNQNNQEQVQVDLSSPRIDKQVNIVESSSYSNGNDMNRGYGQQQIQPRLNISPMDDLLMNRGPSRPTSPQNMAQRNIHLDRMSASSASDSASESSGDGGGGGFFFNKKKPIANPQFSENDEEDEDEEEYEEGVDDAEDEDDGEYEEAFDQRGFNGNQSSQQQSGNNNGEGGYGGQQSFQNNSYYDTQRSAEMILNRKKEILYQFDRLEKKGINLPRNYTINDNLEEMESAFERLKKEREVDASVKFQRKVLTAFCSGVEFLNTNFDPLNVKLDGWSESVNDNIQDYDEIFEELHDKYKGKAKVPPEIRLVFALASSGFMFHMTNSLFKNTLPGLDQVLKQNPDLMRQFAGATANMMSQSDDTGVASMFSNMFRGSGGGGGGGRGDGTSRQMHPNMGGANNMQHRPPMSNHIPAKKMKGPSHMAEIFHDMDTNRIENMSTITTSEISELTEADSSYSGVLMKTKKSGKRTMEL